MFCILCITCVSIVIVLHSLYRAAVNALFSLVVLLIMLCEIVCCTCTILLFEQIKKEGRKECLWSRAVVKANQSGFSLRAR